MGTEGETRRIEFDDNGLSRSLYGERNGHLKIVERATGVQIGARGNSLTLRGAEPDVALAEAVLVQLYGLVRRGLSLFARDVDQAIKILSDDRSSDLEKIFLDTVLVAPGRRPISPRGQAQKAYVEAIREHDIVFGIGPAGTGKTYLAMAMAVAELQRKAYRRIVLTRPAVEAGEKLGFLPGDLVEKVNPYLRPLYDALHDMMEVDRAVQMVERGAIEVAPLAFMRGRTLNDSFVILDEAQNSTAEQMKMFLTRLGHRSQAVITGDITQIDLPSGRESGLIQARRVLSGIEGVCFCSFTDRDVVRHPLVHEIVKAYERADAEALTGETG